MAAHGNMGAAIGHEPNSEGEWQEQPAFRAPPLPIAGEADRWNHRQDDDDYYSQPGALFRLMGAQQKQALFENTARAMQGSSALSQRRHIENCARADAAYGAGVQAALQALKSE